VSEHNFSLALLRSVVFFFCLTLKRRALWAELRHPRSIVSRLWGLPFILSYSSKQVVLHPVPFHLSSDLPSCWPVRDVGLILLLAWEQMHAGAGKACALEYDFQILFVLCAAFHILLCPPPGRTLPGHFVTFFVPVVLCVVCSTHPLILIYAWYSACFRSLPCLLP
jgi:hypothetical protein